MIQVAGVHKSYRKRAALADVSFAVATGEVVGLLGANGAGKTTTLRILAGYLEPDAGRVTIAGHDVVGERADAVRHIGYLPEDPRQYTDMTVTGYLRFRGVIKGVAKRALDDRVDAVLAQMALEPRATSAIGQLSRGLRQRVGLADVLLAQPQVVILDEPTIGLDPAQVKQVREVIKRLQPDHAVVLSSHALREIEAVATRIVVLDSGRVVFDGTVEALAQRAAGDLEQAFLDLCSGAAGEAE